jgi:hypothetical protein
MSVNQTSSLLKKYESEIQALKKWILILFVNKSVLFCISMFLMFILFIILKKYVKKRTNKNRSNDVENQNLDINNDENLDLYKEFLEFQKIVSSILNINTA